MCYFQEISEFLSNCTRLSLLFLLYHFDENLGFFTLQAVRGGGVKSCKIWALPGPTALCQAMEQLGLDSMTRHLMKQPYIPRRNLQEKTCNKTVYSKRFIVWAQSRNPFLKWTFPWKISHDLYYVIYVILLGNPRKPWYNWNKTKVWRYI